MHAPARRAPTAALTFGTCAIVATLWLAGAKARGVDRASLPAAPRDMSFGGARRPPRTSRLALGLPETRKFLIGGFGGAANAAGKREFAVMSGESATFAVPLAPDRSGIRMTLMGQVSRPTGRPQQHLAVFLNGTPAGTLTITTTPSLGTVELPHPAMLNGTNRIELRRPPGDVSEEVRLSTLWFEGASTSTHVDVGTEAAKPHLLGAWGPSERIDERTVQALPNAPAGLRFPSSPLPGDYAAVVVARCPDCGENASHWGVGLAGRELGEIRVETSWTTAVLRIPVDRLVHGDGRLELIPKSSPGSTVVVDRIAIVPLEDHVLLDVGDSRARVFLEQGFSTDESFGSGNASWSLGKDSRITFVLQPAEETAYTIVACARTFGPLAPLTVRIGLNGRPIGAMALRTVLEQHELSVPFGRLATGSNRLEFQFEATAEPREHDKSSSDARELGMLLDWLEVRSQNQAPPRSKAPKD